MHEGPRQLAIVVNPTKFDDLTQVKEQVAQACGEAGWPDATWYETTEDDPGLGQAKQALDEGATLVCPLGGDGTVRCVGAALAGGEVPLGLLPGGTGNLLARNLKLPVDDLAEALAIALTGTDRRIDVGRVRFGDDDEQIFLVMAGMGLDADTVDADEGTKKRFGHLAYVFSGVAAIAKPGFRARLTGSGAHTRLRHTRTIVVGNCGELTGGVALLPDAAVDDGVLDVVMAAPRGVLGWASVLFDILTRRHRGHPGLQRHTGTEFQVETDRAVQCELDGDVVGPRTSLSARIDPGALVVRMPAA